MSQRNKIDRNVTDAELLLKNNFNPNDSSY